MSTGAWIEKLSMLLACVSTAASLVMAETMRARPIFSTESSSERRT